MIKPSFKLNTHPKVAGRAPIEVITVVPPKPQLKVLVSKQESPFFRALPSKRV
jgi:hypothetical protein